LKTLELSALKEKKLSVLLVEKEYNEPYWLTDPVKYPLSPMLHPLFSHSAAFYEFLDRLVKEVKPHFATEELGMRTQDEFREENILVQLFRKNNVPFSSADIDENAKEYLAADLHKKVESRDHILKSVAKISSTKRKGSSMEKEYLVAYAQCLQLEVEKEEREILFSVRESWIVMAILDRAREVTSEEDVVCIHMTSPEHVDGVKELLESLNVRVETIKLSKKIISAQIERAHAYENLLQSMQIQVKPIVGKNVSKDSPHLLFYLDTDRRASPFDICMAYDAGYKAVIPYDNVTPQDAQRIVQDAVFSRGPKAVKKTCFFIGGGSVEKAEEVFEAVSKAMFPPFKASIVIDPSGAYTTAAAMVAKVEDAVSFNKLGDLSEKACSVLGTGAVGQIAAVLLAKLGCVVKIASLNPKRKDGSEYAQKIAKNLADRYSVNVQGVFAPTQTERREILKRVDVVFCAATRGARLIDREMLRELKLMKVLVDINAVPPPGIEGVELNDDMREIEPGIFVIGALTVGELKHRLEKEILREARENRRDVYNYSQALQIARKLLERGIYPSKLALTLKYPSAQKKL